MHIFSSWSRTHLYQVSSVVEQNHSHRMTDIQFGVIKSLLKECHWRVVTLMETKQPNEIRKMTSFASLKELPVSVIYGNDFKSCRIIAWRFFLYLECDLCLTLICRWNESVEMSENINTIQEVKVRNQIHVYVSWNWLNTYRKNQIKWIYAILLYIFVLRFHFETN